MFCLGSANLNINMQACNLLWDFSVPGRNEEQRFYFAVIPGRSDGGSQRSCIYLLGLGGQRCAGAGVCAAAQRSGKRGLEGAGHEAAGGWDPDSAAGDDDSSPALAAPCLVIILC